MNTAYNIIENTNVTLSVLGHSTSVSGTSNSVLFAV